MADIQHANLSWTENHSAIVWKQSGAPTTTSFTDDDMGKIWIDTDTNETWMVVGSSGTFKDDWVLIAEPVYYIGMYGDSLTVALAAIGSTEVTLIINKQITLTTNDTVPANVTLKFTRAGSFTAASARTLTLNCSMDAGLHQIFDSTNVTVGGTPKNSKILGEWFGCIGDGATDNKAAIERAWSSFKTLYLGKGTFYFASAADMPTLASLYGVKGYGQTIIMANASNDAIQVTDGSVTYHQAFSGLTFQSNGAGSTGIKGTTTYTYAPSITDCFFDATLTKAVDANFINAYTNNNYVGYYGSPIRMTDGYTFTGVAGSAEANQNIIGRDIFSNLTNDAIVVTEGWNTQLIGATIDNIGGYAINATGAATVGLSGCWVERCGADGLFKIDSGTSGMYIFSIISSLLQVADGSNTRLFDEGGSIEIKITASEVAGLASVTGGVALANNITKVAFGPDNYFPGGFTRADLSGNTFTLPTLITDNAVAVQGFIEEDDRTGRFTKNIRNSNASFAHTVLGLDAARIESAAYNFLNARSDYDGTPVVVHTLKGNGEAYHKRNVTIGDTGAWDHGHLALGTYHIWVDSTGNLRIKNGTPASDLDGTIVGAQS